MSNKSAVKIITENKRKLKLLNVNYLIILTLSLI